MYRSMFAINNINNGTLSFQKAMPQKDSTSDGTSNFSMSRHLYVDTLSSSTATSLNTVNPAKKWVGGSRDSSQVTTNRRIASVGNGSLNAAQVPTSFTTVRDINTTSDAKTRVRAGGATVPAKVRNYPRIMGQLRPSIGYSLPFRMYSGYFADNVAFFASATPYVVSGTSTGKTNNTSDLFNSTAGLIANVSTAIISIEWYGLFLPPLGTGTYRFSLTSDDASYLWIGQNAISGYTTGNALINNGTSHGDVTVTATISLDAGTYYPIRIQYGNTTGASTFILKYKLDSASDATYTSNGKAFFYYI